MIRAIEYTLKLEGGLANDPDDLGGLTNKGITHTTYDSYQREIYNKLSEADKKKYIHKSVKDITDDEVEYIYLHNYWYPAQCDIMTEKIAAIHFDCAVNCGVVTAKKILQRALGIEDDGIIGSITKAQLKSIVSEDEFCRRYLSQRLKYYKSIISRRPSQKKFYNSWYHRLTYFSKMYGIAFNES